CDNYWLLCLYILFYRASMSLYPWAGPKYENFLIFHQKPRRPTAFYVLSVRRPTCIQVVKAEFLSTFYSKVVYGYQYVLFAISGIPEHFLNICGMNSVLTRQVVVRICSPSTSLLQGIKIIPDQIHQRNHVDALLA